MLVRIFSNVKTHTNVRLPRVIACVLPFSSASCERSFSVLNITKTQLRSTMGGVWLDYLLCLFLKNDLLKMIFNSNEEMENVLDVLNGALLRRVELQILV